MLDRSLLACLEQQHHEIALRAFLGAELIVHRQPKTVDDVTLVSTERAGQASEGVKGTFHSYLTDTHNQNCFELDPIFDRGIMYHFHDFSQRHAVLAPTYYVSPAVRPEVMRSGTFQNMKDGDP
jgi:hypothetical protein